MSIQIRPDPEWRIRTESWPDIASWYRRLRSAGWKNEPMVELVEFIASSAYGKALFAHTSHADLVISRTADFHRFEPRIVVAFNLATKRFQFRFLTHPALNHWWRSECPASRGIQHFEHLMQRRLRWFTKLRTSNNAMQATCEDARA
jgi:hypothetical protein